MPQIQWGFQIQEARLFLSYIVEAVFLIFILNLLIKVETPKYVDSNVERFALVALLQTGPKNCLLI